MLLLVGVLSGAAMVSLLEAVGSGTTTVHLTTVARTTESVLLEVRLSVVHLLLEKDEDLLDELDGVGASEEVRVEGGSLESSLGHEVSSVSGLNLLLLADLRELVVSDIEGLVLENVLLSTSECSGLRALVANECSGAMRSLVSFFLKRLDDLNAFDLTELGEVGSELNISEGSRETLDEEVALLLGVLESLLLTRDLSLTFKLGNGSLDIDLEAIDFLIVEIDNSSLSAFRSVALIVDLVIADESEWLHLTFLVLLSHGDE